MQPQKQSRSFLQKLLQNPPPLPFEPQLLPMLFDVTQEDSTASTDDLVVLIERSQNLTTRVLAIANSAAYGQEFTVSSLRRAISILGFREVRMLAVMVGMAAVIKEAKLPHAFDTQGLWNHQLKTAVIAKTLAAELGGPCGPCSAGAAEENRLSMAPDEAYVAGLLHDIGKVFFAAGCPAHWEAVEALRMEKGLRFFEAEDEYWSMDHALIGAEVLHCWKLPLMLTEPINWHHAPELATSFSMETRLLAAANLSAHSERTEEGVLCEEALALLPQGCDPEALGSAVAQSLEGTDSESMETLVK